MKLNELPHSKGLNQTAKVSRTADQTSLIIKSTLIVFAQVAINQSDQSRLAEMAAPTSTLSRITGYH